MRISILDLRNGVVKQKSFEDSIILSKGEFEHKLLEDPKFDVIVHLSRDYSEISLSLKYSGKIEFECDRCLENSSLIIEADVTTNLSDEALEQMGSIFIDKDTIDIAKLLYDEVYTSMSSQLLCKSDCLGICSNCGENLNIQFCRCSDDYIDPRLVKLKSLL